MHKLFYPDSVVVVGVSSRATNLARNVVLNLVSHGYRGALYAVGSSGGVVATHRVYRSLLDLPEAVDLAVILTPAPTVPAVLQDCGQKGIRRAVIETAGFGEYGERGHHIEQEMRRVAADYGIRFLGPNCIGVINAETGLYLPFLPGTPSSANPSGPAGSAAELSIISQSGGVGTSVAHLMAREGVRLNKMASAGNMLDVGADELLDYLIADPGTRTIFLYLEGIQDGRRLMEVARRSDKPVLLFKSNVGRLSTHIAASHTAALSSDDQVVDAACRQAGITRVHDATSLVYGLNALRLPPLRGRRLAVMSRSGGHAVIAADACEAMGFELAAFPPEVLSELAGHAYASFIRPSNPLDLGDVADLEAYAWLVERMMQQPSVDGAMLLHTSVKAMDGEATRELLERLAQLPTRYDKPLAVYVSASEDEAAVFKKSFGIPVFTQVVETVRALRLSYDRHQRRQQILAAGDGPPGAENGDPALLPEHGQAVQSLVAAAQAEGRDLLLHEALDVLAHYGLPTIAGMRATTAAQVREAAEQLGCPVAVKLISGAVSHKSDVGGVRLNLCDAAAAADAFGEMMDHVRAASSGVREVGAAQLGVHVDGVLVQPMAAAGWELILGGRQDDQFGPVILVGMGGVFVEVLDQVALRIAPIGRREAVDMIDELRAAPILRGARGQERSDLPAVVEAILCVSRLLCDRPEIRELDINPLRVFPEGQGCQALDARISLRPADGRPSPAGDAGLGGPHLFERITNADRG